MKTKVLVAAIAASVMAAGASAIEVSGDVAVTSDYVFRGISQNDNDAALQAGLYFDTASGWNASVWASDVDEGTEIDVSLGWAGEAAYTTESGKEKIFNYGANVVQYVYTDEDFSDDITEGNLFVGTDLFGADVQLDLNYSADYGEDALGDEIEYVGAVLSYSRESATLWNTVWGAHIGTNQFDSDDVDWDYTDWGVSVSKAWPCGSDGQEVDLMFAYYDTDIKEEDGFDEDLVDSLFEAKLSYNF